MEGVGEGIYWGSGGKDIYSTWSSGIGGPGREGPCETTVWRQERVPDAAAKTPPNKFEGATQHRSHPKRQDLPRKTRGLRHGSCPTILRNNIQDRPMVGPGGRIFLERLGTCGTDPALRYYEIIFKAERGPARVAGSPSKTRGLWHGSCPTILVAALLFQGGLGIRYA